MFPDRKMQLDILVALKAAYPESVQKEDLPHFGDEHFKANLHYLDQHGLVQGHGRAYYDYGPVIQKSRATITAVGIDFLADDGGIASILKTITVKIDQAQFEELIASRIQEADLPPEKKSSLLEGLKTLRGEATKTVINRLITLALDKAPEAWPMIMEAVRNAQ